MVVRWLLLAETALFGAAALAHAGVLMSGFEHARARNAESVIAMVLAVGLASTWLAPSRAGGIGLGAQGFALLGTLVGISMIVIGRGPRTAFDLILHAVMLALLTFGLIAAGRVASAA